MSSMTVRRLVRWSSCDRHAMRHEYRASRCGSLATNQSCFAVQVRSCRTHQVIASAMGPTLLCGMLVLSLTSFYIRLVFRRCGARSLGVMHPVENATTYCVYMPLWHAIVSSPSHAISTLSNPLKNFIAFRCLAVSGQVKNAKLTGGDFFR